MRAFLLFVGSVTVLVLAALFAVPLAIDWNSYRSTFETEASNVLGRPVRIGGNVEVRLLPAPRLHVENVRISDATGRFDRPLFRVEGFTIWLSVPPLLQGIVEARAITLDQPELRFAVGPDGKGNWVGLGTGLGELPYLPKDVTLSAVTVNGGTVGLFGRDEEEIAHFDQVNGELSAPALAGPYRFKGAIDFAGKTREIRLSTGVAADEGLRVKTVVSVPDEGSSYTLDGMLAGLGGDLRLTGGLDARVRYLGVAEGSAEAAATADPFVDVKAQVEVDLQGGRLRDLAATFQSDGRPQILSGTIAAVWGKAFRVDTELAAHWLDIDKIAGASAAAGPWPALDQLAGRLGRSFSKDARASLKVRLEQASLGGETVSGIELDVEHAPSALVLKRVSAVLPGSSILSASGLLYDRGIEGPAFEGPFRLRGRNLERFLGWSLPALAGMRGEATEATANAFLLDGELKLDRSAIGIERTRLQIADTAVAGAVHVGLDERRHVEVTLESDRLDLSGLVALPPTLASLLDLIDPVARGSAAPAGSLLSLVSNDSRIDLRFGELVTRDGRLQDLAARISRAGNQLLIEQLDLRTAGGLRIETDGALMLGGKREGQLGLLIEASAGEAVQSMALYLGLPTAVAGDPRFLGAAGKLRLAGLLTVGRRGPGVLDLTADGEADGGRLTLSLRSDGTGKTLGASQVDLFCRMTHPDGARLVGNLVRNKPAAEGLGAAAVAAVEEAGEVLGGGEIEPGELSLRASGVPEKGLSTVLSLRSKPVAASFEGVATLVDGRLDLEGALRATAADAGQALKLARLDRLFDGRGEPLRLAAVLRREQARLQIEDAIAAVGSRAFRGSLSLEDRDGRTYASLKARISKLELVSLLRGLTPAHGVSAPEPVTETGSTSAAQDVGASTAEVTTAVVPWSDLPFDFSAFDGIEAHVEIDAGTLQLLPGFALTKASLVAEASEGRIDLTSLEGEALGGKVRLDGVLKRETAGASAKVAGELSGVSLLRIVDPEANLARASGSASLTLSASGTGLSPRGLVTVLAGSGELRLAGGELTGLAPATVDAVARTVLAEDARNYDTEDTTAMLGERRFFGRFPFEGIQVPVTVADGTLRIGEAVADTREAKLAVKSALDLQTLMLDSEWTLQPKAAEPRTSALPGFSLLYAGSLAEAAKIQPRISAEPLLRELAARRLIGGPEQLQGVWPVVEGGAEAGLAPEVAAVAATETGDSLDIPEPAVIVIPEPTAPQAISRAAPASSQRSLIGSVTTRKLKKSGQQAQQSQQANPGKRGGLVDSKR